MKINRKWLVGALAYVMIGQTLWASTYGEINTNSVVAYNRDSQEVKTLNKKDTFEIIQIPSQTNTYDILLDGTIWTVVEDAVDIRKVIVQLESNDIIIRNKPEQDADIIKKGKSGEQVSVIYRDGNWYQVVLENGQKGYIYHTQIQHQQLQQLPEKQMSKPAVEVIQWSEASKVFARGEIATIQDVYTGKTFQVKRTFGTNHADVEALTYADTAMIKQIWGGFTWERRPVIVHVDGRRLAASLAGMPHAGSSLDAVKNNGMSGVIDLHFRGSRKHKEGNISATTDSLHQKAISIAATFK